MNANQRDGCVELGDRLSALADHGSMRGMVGAILAHHDKDPKLAAKATGLKLGVFRYNQNAVYLEHHREAITAAADQCADEVLGQLIELMRGGR